MPKTMPTTPGQSEAEFDKFAADYDFELNKGLSLTGEPKEYFAEGRMSWTRRRLSQLGAAPTTAMDFGCGTGTSTPCFFDIMGVQRLAGVDPSAPSITIAQESHRAYPATFSLPSAFTATGTIDLAFCNGVFHHIPVADRMDAVRFVFEALRPGGYFAFWENNAWNPATRFVMSRVAFDRDAILLFPHGARRLLRQGGFEVIGTDYLFVFPGALRSLRPLEPWLAKLPLGGQYLVLARKPGE